MTFPSSSLEPSVWDGLEGRCAVEDSLIGLSRLPAWTAAAAGHLYIVIFLQKQKKKAIKHHLVLNLFHQTSNTLRARSERDGSAPAELFVLDRCVCLLLQRLILFMPDTAPDRGQPLNTTAERAEEHATLTQESPKLIKDTSQEVSGRLPDSKLLPLPSPPPLSRRRLVI